MCIIVYGYQACSLLYAYATTLAALRLANPVQKRDSSLRYPVLTPT